MTIKALLFDIDGTLVDTNDMHVLAWEEAFAGIGARFGRAAIHDQIGKGADMLVPALLPHMSKDASANLGKSQGKIFKARYRDRAKPFAGAHDLLARAAAAGLRIVLASSADQDDIHHYLDLLDARSLVETTTSADDVEHSKPAPDIFAIALQRLFPLTPDEVLIVGDTPYDVAAGKQCGIKTIALRSGNFAEIILREAGALAVYKNVAALLAGYDQSPLHSPDAEAIGPAGAADEIRPPQETTAF